jgi:hypothetical protein
MIQPRRRSGSRTLARALICLAGAIVFAGVIVPLIHANRFRAQIQTALENALGRKVEIGEVTLHLLTGPGFQLQNVVVGEDPAFGIEPFAYMSSMQARLRLRTLWTGQIRVASLTLVEPSINLTKNAQGRWNFEGLFDRAGRAGKTSFDSARSRMHGSPVYFPYIGIQDGRVNFKFGDYKSVFHFQDVEAALSPARDAQGRWGIRFAGRPARADHSLSGMGRMRGEGELSTVERRLRLDLTLENSPMEYVLMLVYGRDFGLHGDLGAQARLSGAMSNVQVQGVLRLADIHRWDLLPAQDTRFSVPFRGRVDVPQQSLEMETGGPEASAPLRVHFFLRNYLADPHWTAAVDLNRAPAAPVLRMARQLGAPLPEALELQGSLDGRLDFPGSIWPRGVVRLAAGRLLVPDAAPVAMGTAEAEIGGAAFQIPPFEVRIAKEVVEVSAGGRLDPLEIDGTIVSRGVRVEGLRRHIQAIRPDWLRSVASAYWEGRIFYHKQAGRPAVWSGAGLLSKIRWQPQGLESPVDVAQARVRWRPDALHLEGLSGSLGETKFTGHCLRRLDSAGSAAHEYSCGVTIDRLDLQQLDQWINPQQKPSRWDIWKRALGRTTPATPSWLKSAIIQGSVTVGSLRAGTWTFHRVRSRLSWKSGILVLDGLRAEFGKGAWSGNVRAEFAGPAPHYHLEAAVRNADLKNLCDAAALPPNFQSGTVDLRFTLDAAGRRAGDLRAGLKAGGAFEGRSILLENINWKDGAADPANVLEIRSLDGRFDLHRGVFRLTGLRMTVGREIFRGEGSIGGSPPVLFELAAHGKQVRLLAVQPEEAKANSP